MHVCALDQSRASGVACFIKFIGKFHRIVSMASNSNISGYLSWRDNEFVTFAISVQCSAKNVWPIDSLVIGVFCR